MPYGIMSDSNLSVAANGVTSNIYAGKLFEFTGPTLVRIRMSAAAPGLQATILANGVAVVSDQAMSDSNRWPILPDDLLIQFPFAGGRLLATVRNTTAAAITFRHVTEVIG